MRIVLQRVKQAQVQVDAELVGSIGAGLLLLVGVGKADDFSAVEFLANKVLNLRIFEDELGKMNRSILEVGGQLLAVSQFTLYGDTRKGRRPGFDAAALPEQAKPLFEQFVEMLRQSGLMVETGRFGAHMEVSLINDGPVTFILEYPAM